MKIKISLGLHELTKNEVRKDFREIERTMVNDSDSEASFRSDEVLPSAYPVRPRRNPKAVKPPNRDPLKSEAVRERENQILAAEYAQNYVRAFRFSKKELFEAEEKREQLEVLNQVGTLSTLIYNLSFAFAIGVLTICHLAVIFLVLA